MCDRLLIRLEVDRLIVNDKRLLPVKKPSIIIAQRRDLRAINSVANATFRLAEIGETLVKLRRQSAFMSNHFKDHCLPLLYQVVCKASKLQPVKMGVPCWNEQCRTGTLACCRHTPAVGEGCPKRFCHCRDQA